MSESPADRVSPDVCVTFCVAPLEACTAMAEKPVTTRAMGQASGAAHASDGVDDRP